MSSSLRESAVFDCPIRPYAIDRDAFYVTLYGTLGLDRSTRFDGTLRSRKHGVPCTFGVFYSVQTGFRASVREVTATSARLGCIGPP